MRIPLLAGSRLAVVEAPAESVVVRPPPPAESVADWVLPGNAVWWFDGGSAPAAT